MRTKSLRTIIGVVTTVVACALSLAGTAAASAPIKEVLDSHFGMGVDATTGGNVCTVASKHECQPGLLSTAAGGFKYPTDVAVGANGDIYIGDKGANDRVEVLGPEGEFIRVLGKNVNGAGGLVCVQAEASKCRNGEEGTGAGEFKDPQNIAVDRTNHLVYVLDQQNWRVQEFTETGQFVLMFGKEVDATTKGNICTAASGDTCTKGKQATQGAAEAGSFNFEGNVGNLLAVGGPQGLLYVGDEHRVQEFDHEGKVKGEVSLTSISNALQERVQALAVDETGDIYLTYGNSLKTVRKFDANGNEVVTQCNAVTPTCWPLRLEPSRTNVSESVLKVTGLAIDGSDLAVSESEWYRIGVVTSAEDRGVLLDTVTGRPITKFTIPLLAESTGRTAFGGMAFSADNHLYLANTNRQEVVRYKPLPVAELVDKSVGCSPGAEQGSDETFSCVLEGEINPWGVPETSAFFELGSGARTLEEPVCSASCGSSPVVVTGTVSVAPNEPAETYRMAGYDANSPLSEGEALSGQGESFSTPLLAPKIVSVTAPFVRSSSVVLFGELNPENAKTSYRFEYAPVSVCAQIAGCANTDSTSTAVSSRYGQLATTMEASGLQPGTEYAYALVGENESTGGSEHQAAMREGTFTTEPLAQVAAFTGPPSAIGSSSAVISGSIEDAGRPVTYTFELGVDSGALTKYGIVLSAQLPASSIPVSQSLAVSGLQAGTRYAYRLTVRYADGSQQGWTATSVPQTFTTEGLPAVLTAPLALPLLATPQIEFPSTSASKPSGKAKQGVSPKVSKACRKKHGAQRTRCEHKTRAPRGGKKK